MGILIFEDIISWKMARILVLDIYTIFEKSNDFAFKNQIQRSSVSVMNNIADGFERKTNNEFRQFLCRAKGSIAEVRSMLYLAKDLKKINENTFNKLYKQTIEI